MPESTLNLFDIKDSLNYLRELGRKKYFSLAELILIETGNAQPRYAKAST